MILTRTRSRAMIALLSGALVLAVAGCGPQTTPTSLFLSPTPVVSAATSNPILGPQPVPSATSTRPAATPSSVPTQSNEPTDSLTKAPGTGPTSAPAATPTQPASAPQQLAAGMQALDFTLKDLAGDSVSLSDFQGKKVMLNFWADWCGYCRAEIPFMNKLYGELKEEGFEIVAVNLGGEAAKIAAFAKEFKMEFPVLLDSQNEVASAYQVRSIPMSLFLDEEGVIEAIHIGGLSEEALRYYLGALMQ